LRLIGCDTIATLLLVRMAAIYLARRRVPADWVWAACLSAFAEAGIVGAAPIGSMWWRFLAVLSDCQFLTQLSFPKINDG
jgi:hypothetical protein